ncbi:MAG: FemAB family XrtA/PEP-CTERM system-associated protein [Erythrobacter sp.]
MNAPFPHPTMVISPADCSDAAQAERIEKFVVEMHGSVFQRPQWLNAVEAACGHKATGLIAERMGAIVGWLPLSEVHSHIFGRALVSSGFGVGGGTLSEDTAVAEALAIAATEMAARSACASVELRGGVIPASWHVETESHANFIADLAEDDEAQLLAIPRKQRADVRKSLAADLEISVGRSVAERDAHYAVYAESVRNLGTPVFPKSLFDAMLEAFPDADILTVRHQGAAISSVLSFYHEGTVMPYWGGGLFAARGLKANERMYYELMLHARGRGMTRFDFGRSKSGSGPYRYKKNWGFEPEPMVYGSWSADPSAARNIDPTDSAYAKKIELWKKLPLPVANRLGPIIARGLA